MCRRPVRAGGNVMSILRKPGFISFGLLLIMLLPMMAQAGCNEDDLKGDWKTYSMSVDSIGSFPSATTSCTLRLKASGKIDTESKKTKCFERDYQGLVRVKVAGGSFYVKTTCHVGGRLKLDTTLGRQTIEVDFGHLAKDKDTFSAIGYVVEAPTVITHVTGVRK